MKRILVASVIAVSIAGLVPAMAAGTHGTHGVTVQRPMRMPHVPTPAVPDMQSRIPAPLAPPAQPPVINGPVGPSNLPAMGNGL